MPFQYRARSAAAWDKRANQQGGDFESYIRDEFKTWTPKKGDNSVRILPPTFENADHYGIDIYVHYSVGPAKASVLCLQQMRNERCPICEARTRALKIGDEEEAKQHKASKRVLVWMLDRNDEDRGPMLWAMPYTLDRDFSALAKDKQSGEIFPIDHPDDGFDIYFDRSGEGMLVQYGGKQLARRPSAVNDAALEFIDSRPLPDCLLWRDYATVKALYEGGDGSGAEAVPSRDLAPRRGEAGPERRATNGSTNGVNGDARGERPARRAEAAPAVPVREAPETTRRRVAAPEPAQNRREEINAEIPWSDDEEPADVAPAALSAAERLVARHRNR